MVTKRQQDLIIQNLKSISAEIRLKSLQQVSTLLSVPEPDKIKYYQAALQDSEEAVRKMAQRLLGSLDQAGGQPVDHAPASPGPAPQPAPASPEAADPAAAFVPDAGSGPAEPSPPAPEEPPAAPPPAPAPSPTPATPAGAAPARPSAPGSPTKAVPAILAAGKPSGSGVAPAPAAPAGPGAGSPTGPAAGPADPSPAGPKPFSLPRPKAGSPTGAVPVVPAGKAAPVAAGPTSPVAPAAPASRPSPGPRPAGSMPLFVPPLEEAVDPQLVDPSTIKSIPKMLEQIRFLGQNRPSGHLTHLIVMSQVQHEEVALTALQTLLNIKDPRVPPQMLPLLAIPGFSSQRRFLILKIIMETRSVLEPGSLEQVLVAEKDVIVKSGLVKVYARTAGADGVATLKACLADGDPRVRANTIEVIEEQGIPGCEPEIAGLLKDPENRVKVNSAKFLVKLGHPEAFTTLRTMLGSSEVWLRDSVIFALGEIGDQASLTLLKAALKDPSQGIRLSVLKALAKVNNGPARDVLQGMGGDADPIVAQVARGLFEKIKDTPLRTVTAPKPAAAAAPPVAPPVVPPPVAASPATRSPSPTSPAGADLELPSLDGLTPVRPGAPTPLPVPVAPDADEAPSLPPLRQAPAPGGEATDDEGPALPPSKPSAPSAPIARPGPLPEAPADDAEPPALPPLKPATGRPPTASVAATRSPQLPPAASEEPPVAAPPPSPAGEEEIPLPPMKPAPRRPAPQPAPPPVGEEPPAGSEPPPAAPAEEGPALPSLPGIGSAVARPATPHAAAPPQPLRAVPLSAPSAAARPAASGATVSADGIRFAKPRSAEVYARLCSDSPDDHQAAMKDLPFIMGDDQMILLTKAATNPDDGIRLAVAKLVSRKRGPQAIALMQTLAGDPSPLVTSFAQKALTMMK